MSSGNITTEETRREAIYEDDVLREAALVRNSVLRKALAIAAYEHAVMLGDVTAGPVFMLTWVMQACEEVEKEKVAGGR